MDTNEVRRILGNPRNSWMRTNGSAQPYWEWAYSRVMSWPIVYIDFKPDGTLERHRYDR